MMVKLASSVGVRQRPHLADGKIQRKSVAKARRGASPRQQVIDIKGCERKIPYPAEQGNKSDEQGDKIDRSGN
jgi:hypothetical protein